MSKSKEQRAPKPHCCIPSCVADPVWTIWAERTDRHPADNYTEACTPHVGLLLEPDTVNRVYLIHQNGEGE